MRTEFPRKVRQQALDRANGECEALGPLYGLQEGERCGAPLTTGKYEFDHHWPASEGGKADLENCVVACSRCHRAKTVLDMGRIAKIRRTRDKHQKTGPSRKGRPMAGTKASDWRKRLDGTVERR